MITDRQWFEAKTANTPTFTAQVKRQERHYGQPYPVKRSHLGTIAAICFFAAFILAGILLSVDAIPSTHYEVAEVIK